MIYFIGVLLLISDVCPAQTMINKDEFWTRKDLQARQYLSPEISDKISRFSRINQNYVDDQIQPIQFTTEEKEDIFLRFAAEHTEQEMSDRVNKRELIEKMQEEFYLPITGKIDEDMIHLALSPRCGVTRAFVSHQWKWTQKHITYSIFNYSPDLSKCQTRNAVRKSFRIWEEAIDLTFEEMSVDDKPDIKIGFRYGSHKDGEAHNTFGSKTLAHAFYPDPGPLKGILHFNEAFEWTTDGVPVVNTYLGTADGASCVFPFKWGREYFYECVYDVDEGLDWCSTTRNFDNDGKWGYCPHPKLYTFDGNSAGQPCVFPFRYGNQFYTDCTEESGPQQSFPGFSWCATTSDFNLDKKWGYCPQKAKDIRKHSSNSMVYVAVHEIGHTLGFNHSSKNDSIMFPEIRRVPPKLSYEDVEEAQQVYGKRHSRLLDIVEEICGGKIDTTETLVPTTTFPTTTTTTTRSTATTENPNLICNIDSIDAAMSHINEYFVFKDSMLWKVFKGKDLYFAHAEVHKINEWFKGGPERVDAAYMRGDYQTVLFSGNEYWRFSQNKYIEGPKPVTDLGLDNSAIRAVVPVSSEKVIFYYTGYRVEYNPHTKKKKLFYSFIKPKYSTPDAALGADIIKQPRSDNDHIFFFKGQMVYKVNKENMRVEHEMDLKTYFHC